MSDRDRIDELERRVRELEARPPVSIPAYSPGFVVVPYYVPPTSAPYYIPPGSPIPWYPQAPVVYTSVQQPHWGGGFTASIN